MKRRSRYIILLLMALAFQAKAQMDIVETERSIAIGIKGGVNLASYAYRGDAEKSALPFDSLKYRIRPVFGISVEVPIAKNLYVSPELLIAGRGDSRLFESQVWDSKVRYRAEVNYLEMRLPVSYAIPLSKVVKPYIFAAPAFGWTLPTMPVLGGKIEQTFLDSGPSQAMELDTSNMAPFDVNALVGAGLRFDFWVSDLAFLVKLEAAYSLGFLDTYTAAEHHDQAQAVNVNAYNVKGLRLNRGIECLITVAVRLDALGGKNDPCSTFSRSRYRPKPLKSDFGGF